MKLYISGPMTGVPQYNFPAFDAAATYARAQGYEVINPAEEDGQDVREDCMDSPTGTEEIGQTWGEALSRDVKTLADGNIQGILLLRHWGESWGSMLEVMIGLKKGMKFFVLLTDEMSVREQVLMRTFGGEGRIIPVPAGLIGQSLGIAVAMKAEDVAQLDTIAAGRTVH